METIQLEPKLKKLTVNDADVFLEDFENGKGKITISSYEKGAFTFYWGAMGSDISQFLLDTNGDYFAGKLCNNAYSFDAKKSASNVRKYIREELNYDLPHYKFMSAQKEMREAIKKLEYVSCNDEFVARMIDLPDNLMCFDLSYQDERDFKSIITDVFKTEPWHFIADKPSREYLWLRDFHKALCVKLKSA